MKIQEYSPIILFDGVCNLCNGSVQFILKTEKKPILKFASLQSSFAKKVLKAHHFSTQEYKSIIFINNEMILQKSKAIFMIAHYLKFPFNLLAYGKFLPLFFTDFMYNIIAQKRYNLFGKAKQCYMPTKALESRFVTN